VASGRVTGPGRSRAERATLSWLWRGLCHFPRRSSGPGLGAAPGSAAGCGPGDRVDLTSGRPDGACRS